MIVLRNTLSKLFIGVVVLALGIAMVPPMQKASAISGGDFTAGRIIDDHVFFDSNTMGATDVQVFLNSKVPVCDTNHAASGVNTPPFTCLKDYQQNVPGVNADQYCGGIGGGTKSAATIIKEVAVACSVSPRSLIVLLQKEQSLVTDTWPWARQFQFATGFCVFDTGPPPPSCEGTDGFFNQVYYAARQFQKYAKLPNSFGYRAGQSNYIQFNPNAGCSGTGVSIQNQASAGLYNYTPYQPNQPALANLYGAGDGCSAYGNRNFWRLYHDWFGSPVSTHCFFDPPAPSVTGITFRKYNRWVDQGNVVAYSGTSTNCIESHTWNVGVTSWAANTSSNHPIVSPANAQVHYGDLDGDGIDEPILILLSPSGSGKVEFHVWNRDLNRWKDHVATNITANNFYNGRFTFADVDGDRRDEPVLILLKDTGSDYVEFHVLNNDLRTWRWHVASQLPEINIADGTVTFADVDGDGVDEPVLMVYRNTGSGMVEFHTWNPGWFSWRFNTASNLASIDPDKGSLTFADVDGNGVDEAVLIALRGTGSGRIEFHTWELGVTAWRYHTATNVQAPN